ncbi:MAG: sigma-70 family RNA polymerase sigma factor [Candidatus Njordarchaeia archaeon]
MPQSRNGFSTNFTLSEINEELIKIEHMIWSILQTFNNLSREDKEDLKQEVLIYLWQKVFPRYDSSKAKFSSYAYRCSVNFITKRLKRRRNIRCQEENCINEFYVRLEEARQVKECELSNEKVKFIESLPTHPVIKKKEKKVIEHIISNPYSTQREIAEKMGYSYPSAISMMMVRLRQKLEREKNAIEKAFNS